MKRCPECGQELQLAHGLWSHVRKEDCKIQFIRASAGESAGESEPEQPARRRVWTAPPSSPTKSRFTYLGGCDGVAGPQA